MENEEIGADWEIDCEIDKANLDDESVRTPKLHHKWYMRYLVEKAVLRKHEVALKKLKHERSRFYFDGPTPEQYKMGMRLPFQGKVLKSDLAGWVENDPHVVAAADKVAQQVDKVEAISEIINSLKFRHSTIRNAIDALKFKNGA
jgi:hypothetical protein